MRRLVIAPHVDDDVLGCGGILDKDTTVFYCGVDEHMVSPDSRFVEAKAVAAITGHDFYWPGFDLYPMKHVIGYRTPRIVNRFDIQSLIADLERVIEEQKPEEIILPWPSYNQDHQTVYRASLVATRPHDKNFFVKRVLLYEQPQDFWDWATPGTKFTPTLYRPIDIERKLALYSLMKSQVRGHRSPKMLHSLAAVRGAACGVPYAEAFQILRWVE